MGMTEYGESLLLNCILGISDIPATLYLAVTTREPAADETASTLSEPSDPDYARQSIGTGSANWTTAESGISLYTNDVEFLTASQDWPIIAYWALTSAATDGDSIVWGKFDTPQAISTGQKLTIEAESFGLSVSSPEASLIV
jgi:hypothetical protein